MSRDLIIVESPAKVKTIRKFLGRKYAVEASVGHVRDLPTNKLGVDEDNDFMPDYQVIRGKQKVVTTLRKLAATADHVYLAPDPDREGEAIAWHVAELIKDENTNISRIQFNEITKRAVQEALEHPRPLNVSLFDAQQARRVLDRLVGYKISPLLWKKIKRGISAGRVQSVALRIIVDRERERLAFVPEEYWIFKATLGPDAPPEPGFVTELWKVDGKKAAVGNAEEAEAIEKAVHEAGFTVDSVEEKERSRKPLPPFITSTLQQAANQRMGYTAKKTMNVAQRLYEGLDLGEFGTVALITYMRTDSVRISDDARNAARDHIIGAFGEDFYPAKPNFYKTKGSAQDAHEAIRPVDVELTPEKVRPHLSREQYSLYKLIWDRFVASQMAPARFWDTTVTIASANTLWRVKGERLLFPGFMAVMKQTSSKAPEELPKLEKGQALELHDFLKEQKFTQPPARYSEASLVRELEEKGIGRPSTYAAIISTLVDRDYVQLIEKHFVPTELGNVVCDMLVQHFSALMDVGFTASMEEDLDRVAEGGIDWVALLKNFTKDFYPTLETAQKEMAAVKGGLETGVKCPQCKENDLVIKFGKAGPFLACSGYPKCAFTSNFVRDDEGNVQIVEREEEKLEPVGKCPDCGSDLVIKKSRTGSRFIACTGYPDCRHAEPFTTGVACPQEDCGGQLVEKSSKRGKIFYSCSRYPDCDYAVWDWPVPEPCPDCGSKILVRKVTKARGEHLACPEKSCKYFKPLGEPDEE